MAVSLVMRQYIFRRDGFKCMHCGATVPGGVCLEVDHKLPVMAGGGDEPENLQTLCRDCNIGKGVKWDDSVPGEHTQETGLSVGRPREGEEKMRRTTIQAPPAMIRQAKELGQGSASKGFRLAMQAWLEPRKAT